VCNDDELSANSGFRQSDGLDARLTLVAAAVRRIILNCADFSSSSTQEDTAMLNWLLHLDRILRGDVTRREELRDGRINIDPRVIALMIVLLGTLYGLCMGSYSLLREVPEKLQDSSDRYLQLLATVIKVPALFYLTLIVTFPSLYVFNALVGSRLTLLSVFRLLLASLAVNLAVLASLGPIVMFFSLSTKSYAFIQLLNVLVFAAAGVLGLTFLLQTLHRMTTSHLYSPKSQTAINGAKPLDEQPSDINPEAERTVVDEPSALDMPSGETLGRHTRLVFGCWVVVFAIVGAQMGWVLRPFIGNPAQPFEWFRARESNFFEAVLRAFRGVFGG
jgi:hypothetical protein